MVARPGLTPERIREILSPVKDPELRLSIVGLGLVYDTHMNGDGAVDVLITLTSPACPLGPLIVATIEDVLRDAPGVTDVKVEITFTPPWDPRTMASDEIKMQLGIW